MSLQMITFIFTVNHSNRIWTQNLELWLIFYFNLGVFGELLIKKIQENLESKKYILAIYTWEDLFLSSMSYLLKGTCPFLFFPGEAFSSALY